MSYLNSLYEKPPIHLVDGVVRAETLINFGFQIETGFEEVGDTFGNLYGNGLETYSEARFFNSLSTAIGTIGDLSPNEPFGVEFQSYEQIFVNTNTRKDFVLDLIPNDPSLLEIVSDDLFEWQWKASEELLEEIGDFAVTGRVVIFFTVPVDNFSITFTGKYPTFMPYVGYLPNIYPSPKLLAKGLVTKPELKMMPSGRYKATIIQSNLNSDEIVFGSELSLSFNTAISSYVSPIGDIAVPSEYVNVWRKSTTGYIKLEVRAIYLLSDTEIEFDTDEDIDLSADVLTFSFANIDISVMLRDVYTLLKNHNHDKAGIVATIDHTRLTGLIPISSREDVIYSKSSINNNNHPEYFHREGYTLEDSGTYNNALLGDLLLASTEATSLFNNTIEDSRRLMFGSTVTGASLKYRALEKDLQLYSQENGLSINSKFGLGKQSISLGLNGHELFSYGTDTDYSLSLSSESGRTLVLDILDASLFADMQMKHLYTQDATVTGNFRVIDPGSLTIGAISFSAIGDNVLAHAIDDPDNIAEISFEAHVNMDSADVKDIAITTGMVTDYIAITNPGAEIIFADADKVSSISTGIDAQISIESELPVSIRTSINLDGVSGRDENAKIINGISFIDTDDDDIGEYSSLYVSAQGGNRATPSQCATYMEVHYPEAADLETAVNGLYLLRSTRVDQIERGKKYSWKNDTGDQRVDDLTLWPRAKLAAGYGDFYSIKVNTSDLVTKQGVQFGAFNTIFTTGDGGNCPAGMMVIEALSGVALVASGADPSDCSNISYSSLISGDIQSRGSISIENDLSTGENINAGDTISGEHLRIRDSVSVFGDARFYKELILDGSISILGNAVFNSDIDLNGSLDVANGIEASRLAIHGISEFDEIARFNGAALFRESTEFDGTAIFHDRITSEGVLNANEINSQDTSVTRLTASEKIYANAGIEVTSNAYFHGNILADAGIDVAGNITANGSIYATTINASEDLNVSGRTSLEGTLATRNSVIMNGDGVSRLTVNIDAQFTKRAQLNAGVDVGGESTFTGSLEVFGEMTAAIVDATNLNVRQNLIVGESTQTETLTVRSTAYIDGKLNTGDLTTNGNVNIQGQTTDKFEVRIPATFTEHSTFANGLSASNESTIDGILHLRAATDAGTIVAEHLTAELSMSSEALLTTKELHVNEKATVKGRLSADGGIDISGPVTVVGNADDKFSSAIPAIWTSSFEITDELNVGGKTEIRNTLSVTGVGNDDNFGEAIHAVGMIGSEIGFTGPTGVFLSRAEVGEAEGGDGQLIVFGDIETYNEGTLTTDGRIHSLKYIEADTYIEATEGFRAPTDSTSEIGALTVKGETILQNKLTANMAATIYQGLEVYSNLKVMTGTISANIIEPLDASQGYVDILSKETFYAP